METKKFIESLKSIGYPNAHKLNPQDLEWAFENPNMALFLNWFANGVGADNVVSSDDLQEFSVIEDSGRTFHGQQLEEALESTKNGSPATENIETEVGNLKDRVTCQYSKKKALVSHRNQLSTKQLTLHNRIARMKEVESLAKKSVKKATDLCVTQDVKLNKALQQLSAAVSRLAEIYKTSTSSNLNKGTKDHFLSQLDLSAFQEAEAKYSNDLTAFTKRHFFEGVAQMSGEGSAAKYSLINLRTPDTDNAIKDVDKEQAFLDDCQELQRLRQVFPQSECDRINALVNSKRAHSAVAEAAALLESLKCGHFPASTSSINHICQTIDTNIEKAAADAQPLLESLPDLLRELGGLQGGEVLTGDYDLKLKRQDYFIHKQDQIIKHLVSQRARAEFISLLYELELRCHKETHTLLSAVKQVLFSHHTAWQQRTEELQDPDLTEKKFQGSVVHAQDTSSLSLFHMLGESDGDQGLLCVQKQKIVERAKHLQAQQTCAKAADETMDEKYANKVDQLETCMKGCIEHMYAGSSTARGQPMLSCSDIQSNITSVSASLEDLKKDIEGVMLDIENKKQTLKMNVLQSKERELFKLFHTNPERLDYIVNSLAERTKAQAIQ